MKNQSILQKLDNIDRITQDTFTLSEMILNNKIKVLEEIISVVDFVNSEIVVLNEFDSKDELIDFIKNYFIDPCMSCSGIFNIFTCFESNENWRINELISDFITKTRTILDFISNNSRGDSDNEFHDIFEDFINETSYNNDNTWNSSNCF